MRRIFSVICMFLLLLCIKPLAAGSYQLIVAGFEQVSEFEFEFDVKLRNTNEDVSAAGAWAYNSSQFQIVFNPDVLNGGQFDSFFLEVKNDFSDLPVNQQLNDDDFFFSLPHFSLSVNSPSTHHNDTVLLLDHNEWVTVARFCVSLRNTGNDGFLNFNDVDPEINFRIENCRVFSVDHYSDSGFSFRGTEEGDAAYTKELIPDGEGFLTDIGHRQLSGSWFYGSGFWADSSSWNQELKEVTPLYMQEIPGVNANVVVKGELILEASEYVILMADQENNGGELTVINSLKLSPGARLTVEKLFNDAAAESIVLESDFNNQASLIHNNEGVNGIIQKQLAASDDWNAGNYRWYFLSSPLQDQEIAGFIPENPSHYEFLGWHEPSGQYYSFKDQSGWILLNNGLNFNAGKAYKAAYYNDHLFSFEGSFNVNDVVLSGLTTTGDDVNSRGWHLAGNPFAAALLWDPGSWDMDNICYSVQIWDEDERSFRVIRAGQNEVISPAEGFFMQIEGQGSKGQLIIPATARVHDSPGTTEMPGQSILLKAVDVERGWVQRSEIRFNPLASEGYDFQYDARFLVGDAPAFYSLAGANHLAVNTLPAVFSELVIPFEFIRNSRNSFRIELARQPDDVEQLYLVDRKLQLQHPLSAEDPYYFSASESDDPFRFELHFRQSGVGWDDFQAEEPQMFVFNNILYLRNFPEVPDLQLYIYDIQGRLVFVYCPGKNSKEGISLNMMPGLYVANLAGGNFVYNELIIIN